MDLRVYFYIMLLNLNAIWDRFIQRCFDLDFFFLTLWFYLIIVIDLALEILGTFFRNRYETIALLYVYLYMAGNLCWKPVLLGFFLYVWSSWKRLSQYIYIYGAKSLSSYIELLPFSVRGGAWLLLGLGLYCKLCVASLSICWSLWISNYKKKFSLFGIWFCFGSACRTFVMSCFVNLS